jgi:DsbC/DsbD-like thiol-disulfide interchange protein
LRLPQFAQVEMIVPLLYARRAALLIIAAYLSIGMSGTATSEIATHTPWVNSTNSKARLIGGTVAVDGKPMLLAGVQMRLDDGWKTYWRYPGDSGVPPGFDWTGSKNLQSAEVLFPAPHRFVDGGGAAIGYSRDVVFPVKITPERPGEPVDLNLVFDYGICMDLCIPNEVNLSLTLSPDASEDSKEASLLREALARVPKAETPDTLPRVAGIEAKLDDPEPRLRVEALFDPEANETALFITAGETFVPVPKPLGPPAGGKQSFEVAFGSAKEAAALKGKSLTLTLVSDRGSTETSWKAE